MGNKGGSFELRISKKLSLWLSDGKNDGLICRTDSSGGRATVRSKKSKKTSKYLFGDLKHSDETAMPMFDKWSVECKTGYARKNKKSITKWDILDLIDSFQKESIFEMMWGQCKKDAEASSREPVLIFGRNLRRTCIAVTRKHFNYLVMVVDNSKLNINMINLRLKDGDDIIIVNFEKFLQIVPSMTFSRGSKNDKEAYY